MKDLYNEGVRRGMWKKMETWNDDPNLRKKIISSIAQERITPVGGEWNEDKELQDLYTRAVLLGIINKDPELRKSYLRLLKAGIIRSVPNPSVADGKK